MAGYSGTPLIKKLGIKPGARVQFVNAPRGFDLSELTSEARPTRSGELDYAHLFVKSAADLGKQIAPLLARIVHGGMVWVSWPKRASGVATDLDENIVRQAGLAQGWVDVKVCAVDETWSGLKFLRRKAAAAARP